MPLTLFYKMKADGKAYQKNRNRELVCTTLSAAGNRTGLCFSLKKSPEKLLLKNAGKVEVYRPGFPCVLK